MDADGAGRVSPSGRRALRLREIGLLGDRRGLVVLPSRGSTYVRDIVGPERAPVVVLLHGWSATAELNWSPSFRKLSRRFRVIALDHRGHGRGIRAPSAFTLEDCADDAAALLRHLGVQKAIIVGYSMGGPIAQLLWKRHRHLVDALVMCATSDHFVETAWEKALFAVAPLGVLLSQVVPMHLVVGMVQSMRGRAPASSPTVELAMEAVMQHEWQTILQAAAALGRFDSRSWVADIDVPTALVRTTKDRVVSPRRQVQLGAAIRGASIHDVEGDHDACINHPEMFVSTLVQACVAVASRAAVVRPRNVHRSVPSAA